ncbi:hypothetical protein, partial [Mesomycoplasma ovipneumoniae]|uniref:hypothetical protein n=1 Tax=Mesomycoplasma ovipneumoniae TaxID=29562 RepID=UPI002079CA86
LKPKLQQENSKSNLSINYLKTKKNIFKGAKMNFIISLFQQQTQNGLDQVKSAVNNLSSNTLSFLTIIFGSLVGIVGAAMIIYIIVLLLQAKFAGLDKKQQIYKKLKSGVVIIGVIVILLVAGTSLTAVLNNL